MYRKIIGLFSTLLMAINLQAVESFDTSSFPAQFFPGLDKQAPEKIYMEGLVSLYPGRILDEAPEMEHQKASREALAESLPRGIEYIRVYDILGAKAALDQYSQSSALIIDLRYLYGEPQSTQAFLGYFSQGPEVQVEDQKSSKTYLEPILPETTEAVRTTKAPAIVLVNERTRGPIEPALQGLEALGAIMTVGKRTAGATGQYRPVPGIDGYWVIDWQYRLKQPEGSSLLGIGLDPEIPVDVSPEDDFTGYQLIESGYSARTILRTQLPTLFPVDKDHEDLEKELPVDPILQRAVEVIVALDLLGKLPPR